MAQSSTRAKWRALRSARVSTLKKYLTPPTLSEIYIHNHVPCSMEGSSSPEPRIKRIPFAVSLWYKPVHECRSANRYGRHPRTPAAQISHRELQRPARSELGGLRCSSSRATHAGYLRSKLADWRVVTTTGVPGGFCCSGLLHPEVLSPTFWLG